MSARRRTVRGLSLVELMVGLAVGLLVVAGAGQMLAGQIQEHRRLLLETQLQQDLRNAADMVSRELRRAGHWGAAASLASGAANPFAALTRDGDTLTYAVSRSAREGSEPDGNDRAGFRLRNGTLEALAGGAGWQALTDATTLTVTRLELAIREQALPLACARACEAGDTQCPPRLTLRQAQLRIAGRAVHDATVQRELATEVRLRNDLVHGHCPD